MKARDLFQAMSTVSLIDWYFQYSSPRQAGHYRGVPRRAAENELLARFEVLPKDPRVIVIARGPVTGTYTWETK